MARDRRSALAAFALAFACLLAPSVSQATTIDSTDLHVTVGDYGALQATGNDGMRLFWSTYASGFFLRFADGPLSGRTFGSGWVGSSVTPVSQSAVTRDGDTQSIETVFAVRDGDTEVARVNQVTRLRDGARAFRVTYSVENRSTAPLRYRALTGGDLYVGGGDGGTGVALAGPPRFVGGESPYTGIRGGAEEVLSSRLPGDAAAVPVAPWSAAQEGMLGSISSAINSDGGLTDGVLPDYQSDTGAAVQWDDHTSAASALAPSASARYEVLWHAVIPARLSLAVDRTYRYSGDTQTVDAHVIDAAGEPVSGAALRWAVAGANSSEGGVVHTDGAGHAAIAYIGSNAGSDTISVFADADGDGARGPDEPQRTTYVTWQPRLALDETSWSYQVGTPRTYRVSLRRVDGAVQPDGRIRWSVSGANPLPVGDGVQLGGDGTASLALTARHEGYDTLVAFVDDNDNRQRDDGELAISRSIYWSPPPPQVQLDNWSWPVVGEAASVQVTLHDEFGVIVPGGALRWWVEGANAGGVESATSSDSGRVTLSVPGPHSGTGTVWVHYDRNGDGGRDDGEPVASVQATWSPPPPPPVTRQTLDAVGLNATVSSVGGLQAQFDALPGTSSGPLFDEWAGGVFVRFFDGPLAGQTFGSNSSRPFYGEQQQAPQREGDTVVQRSSWTVRSDERDYLRVRQTARLRDGADAVRLTWEVENLGDAPVRLRLGTVGDVYVDGHDTGTPVSGTSPSFVGVEAPSGFATGLEAVATSRLPGEDQDRAIAPWTGFGVGSSWTQLQAAAGAAGLGTTVSSASEGDAVGVEWADHAGEGHALAAGTASSERYEAVWRLRRPAALRLSPASAVAETRHAHSVTATLIDDHELPRNGVRLRWTISGANPQSGAATTAGLGQVVITWTGRDVGHDDVTVFADMDDDGQRDPGEAQRMVGVDWRAESAVDPPTISPILRPDGSTVAVNVQTQGGQVFFQVIPSAVSSLPRCADGTPQINVTLNVNVDAAAGHVVDASASLLGVDPATLDLLHPVESIIPAGLSADGTFQFVVECLRPTSLYLCYDLQEGDLPIEHFCVALGGMGYYDPSGTVYDADAAALLVAAGASPRDAARRTAVAGAHVLLQRSFEGAFRQVLSGDPFVTPNVNPTVTEGDGHFSWSVSPGTYRVVVTARGYRTETSRSAVIPPPDLDLDVGLHRDGAPLPPAPAQARSPYTTGPAFSGQGARAASAAAVRPAVPRTTVPAAPCRLRAVGKPKLDRRGVLRVRLACAQARASWAGKLQVVAADRSVLRSARVAVAAGAGRRVSLRLSKRAKATLRRTGARRVGVVVVAAGGVPTMLATARVATR